MVEPPSRRRGLRLEIVLLVVLVLAAATLFAWRLTSGGGRARSIEETFLGSNDPGLSCLKRVIESSPARGEEDPDPDGPSLEEVAAGVERVRQLQFEQLPEPMYLGPAELAERATGFAEEYTEEQATRDARILTAFGAMEPGTDLRAAVSASLGEQVAGFYEPESEDLIVVGAADDGLDPLEESILAHELTHALTDQALGLPPLEVKRPGEEDAVFAAMSLVEGDATLTEALYSSEGLLAASASIPALSGLATAGSGLPYHFMRTFLFPYAEGLGFACRRFEAGGWEGIDAAYREPPRSTHEILFPGTRILPSDPRDPVAIGGWTSRTVVGWGAADLMFLFEAPGGDPGRRIDGARDAVAGWRGGEVHVLERESGVAVLLALDQQEGPALCAAIGSWYAEAFPDDDVEPSGRGFAVEGASQDAVLRCHGDEIRLGIGPDRDTARRLAA
jgi:hypothetical protein